MAKRRKPTKKRRGKSLTDSSSTIRNSVSSEQVEMESSILTLVDADSVNCSVVKLYDEGELRRSRLGSEVVDEGGEDGTGLRLPEMKDTSMDSVGQPLCDVIDQLNEALDREERPQERHVVHLWPKAPTSCRPLLCLQTFAALPPTVQTLLPRVVATMTLQSIASHRLFQVALKVKERQKRLQDRNPS